MSVLPIDDDQAPLYSVGQVSVMLDVQQAFLRRLDEHEIVRPRRTEGRQRRYSRREVTLLQYVIRLVGEGMTLAAVRRILELEARVQTLESERDEARRRLADTRSRSRRAQVPPLS
jgi:MerR family transcriptional regulator, heat shock protein HspR